MNNVCGQQAKVRGKKLYYIVIPTQSRGIAPEGVPKPEGFG
jgi:hypothetical protein